MLFFVYCGLNKVKVSPKMPQLTFTIENRSQRAKEHLFWLPLVVQATTGTICWHFNF